MSHLWLVDHFTLFLFLQNETLKVEKIQIYFQIKFFIGEREEEGEIEATGSLPKLPVIAKHWGLGDRA